MTVSSELVLKQPVLAVDTQMVYCSSCNAKLYTSHQWLRELKRHGQRTICAIYFRIKHLPQNTGWRYYPEAHGKEPCDCLICLRRDEIKSRKIREKWEADTYLPGE